MVFRGKLPLRMSPLFAGAAPYLRGPSAFRALKLHRSPRSRSESQLRRWEPDFKVGRWGWSEEVFGGFLADFLAGSGRCLMILDGVGRFLEEVGRLMMIFGRCLEDFGRCLEDFLNLLRYSAKHGTCISKTGFPCFPQVYIADTAPPPEIERMLPEKWRYWETLPH